MGYRYIGAKNKLSDQILDKIRDLVNPSSHIIDLMCGTGQVSLSLREAGYRVTAVDLMTYSFHHANVQLFLNQPPDFSGLSGTPGIKYFKNNPQNLFDTSQYEAVLSYLNNLKPNQGHFWNEYGAEGQPENGSKSRKYFTADNAGKIDAIRKKISEWRRTGSITDLEYSLLIHDLIMASNDIANIAGTYGHYLSKLISRALDPLILRPSKFSHNDNIYNHKVIQGYAEKLSKSLKADLCYIDPPYMKRQYAANYHILETIARGDEPEAVGVSGLRPWRDQYSNFCSKVHIRNSFRKIFSEMDCPNFLISYSEDGLLTIEEMITLFEEFGSVDVTEIKYKRFKSNNSQLDEFLTEYLICIKKSNYLVQPQDSLEQSAHVRGAK